MKHRDRWIALLGPLLIAGSAICMLVLSWRKWPDLLIDFGQQLYLAWQMSEGRTLYTELVCNYGPLAPYANSWAFECFGASVMTLVGLNLAVFLGIAWLIYALALRIGDRLSAAVAGIVLMLVFGFSQVSMGGNFNYAAPYENGLTIGLLPALAALWFALRYVETGRGCSLVGICLGLAFLTKPEVFLAGGAGVASTWLAMAWYESWSLRRVLRTFASATLWLTLPLLVATVLLAFAMPVGSAIGGVLGSWPASLGSGAAELAFYRQGMGFTDVPESLRKLAISMALWGLVGLLGMASAAFVARLAYRYQKPVGILWATLLGAAAILAYSVDQWHRAGHALQVGAALVGVLGLASLRKFRRSELVATDISVQRTVARLGFAAFALTLLLKMIMNVRVYHYGFVLAMPATVLALTAMLSWLPAWHRHRGRSALTVLAVHLALIVGFTQSHVRRSVDALARSKTAVGQGANELYSNERAHFVNPVLALLERLAPSSLAVFPEGAMLNFLAGIPNPTPFYNFVPTGYAIFGEARILDALKATPPEVLVLCDRDTSEFGFRYFGQDYAQQTRAWMEKHYREERVFGSTPLTGQGYGIAVWKRRQ